MRAVVSSPFPPSRPAFPALLVAGRPVWVSLILARWYANPCGLCVPRARSGCPSGFPRVSFVCVCARTLAASDPPPLPGVVRRAHLARSRCWALVGPFHAVRPPPRVLPRSRGPFGLLRGEAAWSRFPLPGLGLRVSGWGQCGRGDLSPTQQRARSRAGFARCGGGTRVPGGGAPLAWVLGVRGRALSHPRPLVFSGVRLGPTTHWLWVREVQAWGPVTSPTARALASWLCALWDRHEGARGGHLLPGCGASGVGRSPTPHHSSFRACGRGPLPTCCGCGGCGRGDPSPTPTHALLRAGFARCGGGRRAPGGGRLSPGRPGLGAVPPPTACPLGRAARAHYPLAVGAGGACLGTRHQLHSARSCELALRVVGAACPGGAPLALV